MAEIVWLASYPKSGNTWTRSFITSYLGEETDELDINHLTAGPISSHRNFLDQAAGIEASCLLPTEIDSLRAAAFRLFAGERKRTQFLKTHDAWQLTAQGEPIFPPDISRGVVYIARNPLDVVVSS